MATKSVFDAAIDQVKFTTQTNGDRIDIRGVHLGAEAAANLATLINGGQLLEVTVKVKAEA